MRPTPKYRLAFAALFAAVCCSPVRAADRVEPGQWQLVMTSDSEPHTVTHCVTAEEAANVNGTSDEARAHSAAVATKSHCTLTSFDAKSDSVSMELRCGDRTVQSTSTFEAGAYTSTILTSVAGGAPAKTTVVAKRLGACP